MFRFISPERKKPDLELIQSKCDLLGKALTRRDLGHSIAAIVLTYSPRDIEEMRWNFSEKIRTFTPEYRTRLENTMKIHLHGTYQAIRLMEQQGTLLTLEDPVDGNSPDYWKMVAAECTTGDKGDHLRFLKYLLSGFCIFIQRTPGHPVGMPFPGGDKVDLIDGVYYCPVRTKVADVDAALCPFCPALQTPEIGYLKPPVNASSHRKQEFIKDCYDHHHFNG